MNKSLFSINKLNQNLVLFARSQCVRDLGICGGSRRYGFEYVFEGSFGHLYIV